MSDLFYTMLPHRGLIHIEGKDRHKFLQGLISNDIEKAQAGELLYACLLTPQGKFLHDFFIHSADGVLLLDCEGGTRARDLYERLLKYRLRSDVQISIEENHPVHAVFGQEEGLRDPRHPEMGMRRFEKPNLDEKSFEEWDTRRIRLGIPDGSRDMQVERSTLLECNIDKLNGIDWDKGCYMGQELTARMHHRGLAKKHLYPVTLSPSSRRKPGSGSTEEYPVAKPRNDGFCLPAPFTDIHINGELIGNMRSSCGDTGLAVLKDEALEKMKDGPIMPLPVFPENA